MTTPFAKSTAAALALATLFACGGKGGSAPEITAQPENATVAAGGNATFAVTATGASLQYQWTLAGAPIAGATGSSYTTPATTAADDHGVYAVTVSNSTGSETSASAVLRVVSVAIATEPADLAIAQGNDATITLAATGSGTLSYQWSKDGAVLAGWNSAVYRLEAALSSDSGGYSCVVSSTLDGVTATVTSRTAQLNVVAAPAITTQPKDITLLAGTPASFSVVVAAGDTLTFQWQKDGADIASATSASYSISAITASDAGSYGCVVTNTKASFAVSTTTSSAQLTVATPPALTDSGNLLAGEGAPASLAVVATLASGMSAATYQWTKNGAVLPAATASVLTLGAVAASDAGTYNCVVTSSVNGLGAAATSNPMVLTVVPRPALVTQPSSVTVFPGDAASFTVSATASDAIAYQWKKDGAVLPSATAPTLSISAATVNDAGSYICTVSNTRSGVTATQDSAPALLTITAAPQITAQSGDVTVLETQTATFTVSAVGSGLSYQWYRGDTAIDGATAASYTTPPTQMSDSGTAFHCVVSNGNLPNASSAPATLTVQPTPASLTATVTALCTGEGSVLSFNFPISATATISGDASPIPVTRGGTLAVYPMADTTYSLNITDGGTTTAAAQVAISVKTYQPTNLYVVVRHDNANSNDSLPGRLKRFRVSATDNSIVKSAVNNLPTGRGPGFVVATPDERHLYVLNNALKTLDNTGAVAWDAESSVSPFNLDATGTLSSAGPAVPLSTCAEPWSAVADPSGQHLFVGCSDGLEVFNIASDTGLITHAPTLDVSIPGRRQGDLLLHPTGNFLYVIDNMHSLLQTYALAASGQLTFVTETTVVSRPDSMTFDRAGTLLFTRGSLPQLPNGKNDPSNAAIYVYGVDPITGALTPRSTYSGFDTTNADPNRVNQPFVRGLGGAQLDVANGTTNTPDSHHGLTYSRKPDVDQLINAYDTDPIDAASFSQYSIDVEGGAVLGDFTNPNWLGSPAWVVGGNYGDAGQSMIPDRSGSIFVLPVLSANYFIPYYSDATGGLRPPTVAIGGEVQFPTGITPMHAVFTGTQQ